MEGSRNKFSRRKDESATALDFPRAAGKVAQGGGVARAGMASRSGGVAAGLKGDAWGSKGGALRRRGESRGENHGGNTLFPSEERKKKGGRLVL